MKLVLPSAAASIDERIRARFGSGKGTLALFGGTDDACDGPAAGDGFAKPADASGGFAGDRFEPGPRGGPSQPHGCSDRGKAAAWEMEALADDDENAGEPGPASEPVVFSELAASYYEYKLTKHVADGQSTGWAPTLRTHLQRVANHELPDGRTLGELELDALAPEHLEAVMAEMARGGKPNGKPYSLGYVNGLRQYVLQALEWAAQKRRRWIARERLEALRECEKIEPGRLNLAESKRITAVSEADIDALVAWCSEPRPRGNAARDSREIATPEQLGLAVQLARATGVRPGELVSLSMDQVSPAPGEAGQRGYLVYRPKQHKTKAKGRDRWSVIPPESAWILEAAVDLAKRGGFADRLPLEPYDDSMRVFPWRAPNPRTATGTFRKTLYRMCERAGLEPIAPNRIRHRFGTAMTGVSPKGAQGQMGHASMSTTDIYSDTEVDEAVKMFDLAAGRGTGKPADSRPEAEAPTQVDRHEAQPPPAPLTVAPLVQKAGRSADEWLELAMAEADPRVRAALMDRHDAELEAEAAVAPRDRRGGVRRAGVDRRGLPAGRRGPAEAFGLRLAQAVGE